MKIVKLRTVCALLFSAVLLSQSLYAQDSEVLDRIHVGIIEGMHFNQTRYSNLDSRFFSSPGNAFANMGGVFAEFELGENRRFSLRPELVFTSRNTPIHSIKYATYIDGTAAYGDLDYDIKSRYVDLRVPIMVNFGSINSVRFYLFAAPTIGICKGGTIKLEDALYKDEINISKANMAPLCFATSLGAGLKIPVSLGSTKVDLGLEASYEIGLTDTYGDKEKNGMAIANNLFSPYDITGTRKYNGIEVAAHVSVPLSVFSKRHKNIVVEEPPVRIVNTPKPEAIVKEKPCYTLEEIVDLIDRGKKVNGLTICAIDVVNFDFGKSTLTRDSRMYLDKIVSLMSRTTISLEIKGHTDNKGTKQLNMELSYKRSKAVYDYLVSRGVKKERLGYSYYGMEQPIADNDTEEGRRMNRRVEFDIK